MQFLCDQDREDFEQEKLINEWLNQSQPGRPELLEQRHINRQGNARNTLVRASFSIDQSIGKDNPRGGTFADIVAGSDGRDLENGCSDYHFDEHFNGTVWETLTALGLDSGDISCLIKMWLHSGNLSEKLSLTSMIDSEWETL